MQADSGFVLNHPKFRGEFLREEYFDRTQIQKIQKCFSDWGGETFCFTVQSWEQVAKSQ